MNLKKTSDRTIELLIMISVKLLYSIPPQDDGKGARRTLSREKWRAYDISKHSP
jgi:hypothetical protein